MFLNPNEEKIISNLYNNLNNIGDSTVSLIWDSGSIQATFDTCFEDMDDEGEIGQLRHDLNLLFGGGE